jgi:Secretion system C-terminal sorting domain
MKKNYLLTLTTILALALALKGQPILTNENTSFQIGEVYTQQSATYMDEGNSGAMVTWDFSNLTLSETSVLTAYDPSESSAASSFPDATLFLTDAENNLEDFYKASASSLERLGYSVSGTFLIALSNPQTFLTFPFTYNTVATDDFYGEYQISGLDAIRSGSCSVTGDAYGTIILPSGTYSNAIRLKFTEDYTDEIPLFSQIITYSNTQYLWYVPGNHFPVFSSFTLITNEEDTTTASVYQVSGSVGLNQYATSSSISVSPNPAHSATNVLYELTNKADVNITVVNGIGQTVEEVNFLSQSNGKYNYTLDLNKFNKGVYVINLKIDGKIITKQLMVE